MLFIKTLDFIVMPIMLLGLITFLVVYTKKRHPKHLRKYFILGFILKVCGAILLGLLNELYFGGAGDSTYYFNGATSISRNFFPNFSRTISLLFNDAEYLLANSYRMNYFTGVYHLLSSDANLMVMKFGGIFGLFTLQTYLGISVCFAFIGFVGNWKIFKVFEDLYPDLHKPLAFACLFVPTILVWGAGILKDPILMGFFGLLFFNSYRFFIKKEERLKSFFIILLSSYMVITVKVYVFLAFVPAFLFWLVLYYRDSIKNKALRMISLPFLTIVFAAIGVFGFQKITSSEQFRGYSLEFAAEKASNMVKNYGRIDSKQQLYGGGKSSPFNLGDFDPTIQGMIKKAPTAIFSVLFRPFPWEVNKILNIPTSLESFFFLIFFLYTLLKTKIVGFFRIALKYPVVLYCLVFSIIFAFVVGISTANFGTIVRYRIPCIPFLLIGLVLINSIHNGEITNKNRIS